MVISNIIGGLGNQMFQYAAGRALSLDRNESFHLDITGFNGYGLHQGYELSRVFACPAAIASKMEIRDILGWQYLSGIKRVLARPSMKLFRSDSFVVDPHYHYWPDVSCAPTACYLYGYWQSERYFKHIEDVIRNDFTFNVPLDWRNQEIAFKITNTQAISLHVRRGDYLSNKNSAIFNVCSLDYYRKAVDYIVKCIENPVFYVFSDDMAWAKENLSTEFPCVYIDHNRGLESYRDMQLMSLCKHHIIANSTFSWWGAWLNAYPSKIVVAPRQWFLNKNTVDDLLPSYWIDL